MTIWATVTLLARRADTPVDRLLALKRIASTPPGTGMILVATVAVAALLACLLLVQSRRGARRRAVAWEEFLTWCRDRSLSAAEIQFLAALAKRLEVGQPLAVCQKARHYERGVAGAVAELTEPGVNDDHRRAVFQMIGALRLKLGFKGLSDGRDLYSTRQLRRGDVVRLGDPEEGGASVPATVEEMTEASLTVKLPDGSPEAHFPEGTALTLTVAGWGKLYLFRTRVVRLRGAALDIDQSCDPELLDRRRYQRVDTQRRVLLGRFSLEVSEGKTGRLKLRDGQLLNISVEGARVRSPSPAQRGAKVVMELDLPEVGAHFWVLAIVCNHVPGEGEEDGELLVQFVALSLEEQRHLTSFINHLLRKESRGVEAGETGAEPARAAGGLPARPLSGLRSPPPRVQISETL
jgi:hypothetical protein